MINFKTHKGMIIKKKNMPQISQILTEMKLPLVVSSVLIFRKAIFLCNLSNLPINRNKLWQKNIEFKQFNIRHV